MPSARKVSCSMVINSGTTSMMVLISQSRPIFIPASRSQWGQKSVPLSQSFAELSNSVFQANGHIGRAPASAEPGFPAAQRPPRYVFNYEHQRDWQRRNQYGGDEQRQVERGLREPLHSIFGVHAVNPGIENGWQFEYQ